MACENILTVHQAAKHIREATDHPEFTTNDLRKHMFCDCYYAIDWKGTTWVGLDYVEKLLYRLGKAGF